MEPEEFAEGILETAIERLREKSASPSEFEELPEWTPEAKIET